MKIRLYEQVDKTGELFTYSWILDGVSGRAGSVRRSLVGMGWKFVRGYGCRGCYVTKDYATAKQTCPSIFGVVVPIESNGTHKTHNTKMYEDCPEVCGQVN